MSQTTRAGFVGLGAMGEHMAAHLASAGQLVSVLQWHYGHWTVVLRT